GAATRYCSRTSTGTRAKARWCSSQNLVHQSHVQVYQLTTLNSAILLHCQSQDVQNALGLRVPNSTGERRPLDLCSLLLLGVGVAEPVIRGHEGRDRLLSEVPN